MCVIGAVHLKLSVKMVKWIQLLIIKIWRATKKESAAKASRLVDVYRSTTNIVGTEVDVRVSFNDSKR